jgi:hypothetical protein
MKRFPGLLIATVITGFSLVACDNLSPAAPTIPPMQPVVLEPTLAGPTAVVLSTASPEPLPTPTARSFSGMEVSFDQVILVIPTEVATGGSGILVAEAKKDEVAPWDVAPEHIQINLEGYILDGKLLQPSIYVYPAQTYAQLQERGSAAHSLDQLRAVLAQPSMVNVKELPFVPFFNVPQLLAAQVKVIPFQHGRGVRMVTEYAMGLAIINNYELIYHFEGLTEDEQYYIIAILPVTAPGLPEDGQPGSLIPSGGIPAPDFNDMNANWLGYYGDARQMLQGLDPSAYNPNLNLLDALIESLTLAISN